MLVTVTGFGSVWRRKFANNQSDPRRFARGVYYNTTGVDIAGTIRQRPRIAGYARFNACGGFDPHRPNRMIGRVFECADPCVWQGNNKLLFRRVLPKPEKPDGFLVVVQSKLHGVLAVGSADWRSSDTWLLSFSESGEDQQAMLLMQMNGWIHTRLGGFVLEPEVRRPWTGRLVLAPVDPE
jgi:hypothetical protein